MRPEPGLALGGRYRLVRQIAVGGMGEVWVAKDESLARDIAVKVLKEEFVGNPDFLNRFRVEARNAASLSHAHIAQLYDYGEQDGSAYLVMELVHGEPMSDLLEREPVLPITKLLKILSQTARALHAAHVGGVVHRDIKPGNIIIEHSGDVKITDFGVSLAANQVPMTAAGMVMGTAQYLSPEQAIGKPATGASDIYALGIVAYEAIAGNRPFTGKTPVDIAVSHVNDPVPPLPKNTPADLGALVMRMLAKNPLERPRSGAALAQTFEALFKEFSDDPWRGLTGPRNPSPDPSRVRESEDHGPQLVRSPASTQLNVRVDVHQPGQGAHLHRGNPGAVRQQPTQGANPSQQGPRLQGAERINPPAPVHPAARPSAGAPYSSAAKAPNPGSPQPLHTQNRGNQSPSGRSRQTSEPAGSHQTQPDRRETTRTNVPQPNGIKGLIQTLGPVGLVLLGVVIAILVATVVKGALSAESAHHSGHTVAGKFSSVEFTSDAETGKEVGTNRGKRTPQVLAAQISKDAQW